MFNNFESLIKTLHHPPSPPPPFEQTYGIAKTRQLLHVSDDTTHHELHFAGVLPETG